MNSCSNSNATTEWPRRRITATPAYRRGYTLLEMLLVVAIIAAVAAMAIPNLRGPMERTSLRTAAIQLQNVIAKARHQATNSGKTHRLVYKSQTNRSWIESDPEPMVPDLEMGSASEIGQISTSRITENAGDSLSVAEITTTSPSKKTGKQKPLPNGIQFYLIETKGQTDGVLETSTARPADLQSSAVQSAELQTSNQSASNLLEGGTEEDNRTTISFYPNGRADDAVIRIGTERSYVDVTIRGLTGTVVYSKPKRWPTTDENGNPIEPPGSSSGMQPDGTQPASPIQGDQR